MLWSCDEKISNSWNIYKKSHSNIIHSKICNHNENII